jgi:hypothetical protein
MRRTRTGKLRTSNVGRGMDNLLWRSLSCFFVVNFSGKLWNFDEPKIGGASIVVVIFIAVSILGRMGVKSCWACARFLLPFRAGPRVGRMAR